MSEWTGEGHTNRYEKIISHTFAISLGRSRSLIYMAIVYWGADTVMCRGNVVSTLAYYDGEPSSIPAVETFFCFVVFFLFSFLLFIFFQLF